MTRLDFGPVHVERRELAGGAFMLRSLAELKPHAVTTCEYLDHWAQQARERPVLVERDENFSWRKITYGEAQETARSIAQGLLNRAVQGKPQPAPIMILSENTIDHGLLMFGAFYAGQPVAPVSPAYALISQDFGKLKHVFDILEPTIIYVADAGRYEKALAALDLSSVEVIASNNPADRAGITSFKSLCQTIPTAQVEEAQAALGADTIAKILFTSGSTGLPKGVINTHRMMCSNQQALAQVWPFIENHPPVLVDWLPWSHTFGGNHNINLVLRNGGTLYIDGGKPLPGLIETTVANLSEVAPTIYFNVPRGYDQLLPFLEADEALRDKFFSALDTIFYAAAALPQNLWQRLEKLSLASLGEKITMTSAWGSTETAPMATSVHFKIDKAGVIGVPVPGTEVKLVPNASKMEIRVRGANVFPGYYRQPDLTREAFDADGFYRIGDAVKLADENDPNKGLIFDGRVAEDFKLLTGSWVNVANIRIAAIAACQPLVQDAVVTGHDRDEIGLLIFANPAGLVQISGLEADQSIGELISHPKIGQKLAQLLGHYNRHHPASSQRIARAAIMKEPPKLDGNEITDKGYINQRAVLENRVSLIDRLYDDDDNYGIIID